MNRYPIRIIDEHLGRLTLEQWTAVPLSYVDLLAAPARERAELKVQFQNVLARDETGKVHDWTQYAMKFDFTADHSTGAVALVPGGWLPSSMAGAHYMLVPDRNVVSSLTAARRSLDRGSPDDLMGLLLNEPVQISPLVFALEGNQRRPPSVQEIAQQIDEARDRFQAALPNAEIVPDRASAIRGAQGLWSDMRVSQVQYERFLVASFPILRPAGPSPSKRASLTKRLCLIAAKESVSRRSLPFLLAWLAIALPQGLNPAMELLKPDKNEPLDQKAYGALADIRQLQLLVYASALFPHQPIALLTHDRALAQIWTGLGITNMRANGKICDFNLSLGSDSPFFANATESEITLFSGSSSAN